MTRHQSALRTFVVALAAALLLATPAFAQEKALSLDTAPLATTGATDSTSSAARASVGPTVEASRVAVQRQPAEATAPAAAPRAGYGQPIALMVVGGAALLAGLVIGGDAGQAIAIGGAVIGLVGLYQYLQ